MSGIFDIAIIGGGIAGASLAYFVAPHRSVVLFEQETALGYHATGRSAAEYTRRFHSPAVGRLTDASYDFLTTPPEGFTETPLLHRRGNLLIAGHEKAKIFERTFAYENENPPQNGSPIRRLTVEEAVEMVAFLDSDYVYGAFFDPDCWDIEVENLLQGYAKGARKQGAEFRNSSKVETVTRKQDHWEIRDGERIARARMVVNAAGAWVDPVAVLCGVPGLGIVPHRRTAINVKVSGHDLSNMPEVNEIEEDFYFKPDAGQLFVSPADETPMEPHDAWADEMDIAYAAHYLTECTTLEITHVAHSWAGLRTFAPDRLPVVGFSEAVPGFFWFAGQGGFGIQTSPALGQLAAAALTGSDLPENLMAAGVDVAGFLPSRFGA
ncbi:NAD(P)/FAD-dependent oxidoreductase [Roseibium sp. SCP14]|uniref:NAD(P)/FAD-dependent oxidoreductase n=1 Tax=Roseibium sp. SCP14 TaxID=3141375 RepID=UPI0033351345